MLPAASLNELKVLLRTLRDGGQIHLRGTSQVGAGTPAPGPSRVCHTDAILCSRIRARSTFPRMSSTIAVHVKDLQCLP